MTAPYVMGTEQRDALREELRGAVGIVEQLKREMQSTASRSSLKTSHTSAMGGHHHHARHGHHSHHSHHGHHGQPIRYSSRRASASLLSTRHSDSAFVDATDSYRLAAVDVLANPYSKTASSEDLMAVPSERVPKMIAVANDASALDIMTCPVTQLERIAHTLPMRTEQQVPQLNALTASYSDLLSLRTRMNEHFLSAFS